MRYENIIRNIYYNRIAGVVREVTHSVTDHLVLTVKSLNTHTHTHINRHTHTHNQLSLSEKHTNIQTSVIVFMVWEIGRKTYRLTVTG